jgi:hypothetical protein
MLSSRFKPTIVSYLPDERPTVVYVSSFADAVYSLLSDPQLMDEDNLSFPHPEHPFCHEPPATSPPHSISQLHHGSWHQATQEACCTAADDVLCSIICYTDGVSMDAHGRLGLIPLNMTLGILNAATRTRKELGSLYIIILMMMLKPHYTRPLPLDFTKFRTFTVDLMLHLLSFVTFLRLVDLDGTN